MLQTHAPLNKHYHVVSCFYSFLNLESFTSLASPPITSIVLVVLIGRQIIEGVQDVPNSPLVD
jgi:hypothetical protein